MVGRLDRRLGRVEAAARMRAEALDPSPGILVVYPDDWPAVDLAAYEAAQAAGDHAVQAEVVARNHGQRPGPQTQLIEIRVRRDGPQ